MSCEKRAIGQMRDLTGMKSGKLTVLKPYGKSKDGHYRWLCQCDCGNMTVAQSNNLVSQNARSCGCLRKETMGDHEDLTGMRFGRLTAIKRVENKNNQVRWLCKCDCGNDTIAVKTSLKRGHTKSCGCYAKEMLAKRTATHNGSKTRLYGIWCGIRKRCDYPKDKNYEIYGGRGIKVCDEWQSYEPFRDWAMANGYSAELTIDRIDCNGDYEPNNCRWATLKEQANNKRSNHFISFNGKTLSMREWAALLGVNYGSLRSRIQRGWSVERAFATPLNANKGVSL